MKRWNYDVVFYRVFCLTMISTAFIFTLILTNIFIDIDGLLSNKEKAVPHVSDIPERMSKFVDDLSPEPMSKFVEHAPEDAQSDILYDEDGNYDVEIYSPQRTKRSIETENILLQVGNPIMKKLITSKLANLLEELDKEEPKQNIELQPEITTVREDLMVTKNKSSQKNEARQDLLHLAMHNILLQGLIGHMDLNDVFKNFHMLLKNFDNKRDINDDGNTNEATFGSKEISGKTNIEKHRSYEEHKLFEEIINCKQLKDEMSRNKKYDRENKTEPKHLKADKHEKVIIKTVIEINDQNLNKKSRSRDVEGLIRLIYNGKTIKLNQMEEKPPELKGRDNNRDVEEITIINNTSSPEITETGPTVTENVNKENKNPLNIVLEEYLKKHPFPNYFDSEIKSFETKRLKRQIKIRYINDTKTSTFKSKQPHNKTKKADDDLYIEIETHFDGKGVKGERKKKLVKSLIEKIQKALNSDIEQPDEKERIKFIKRVQDPIDVKEHSIVLNKVVTSYEPIGERLVDPIGRNLQTHENVINRYGETWKKKAEGPSFLTVSKSVNSAEMRQVNIDYDMVARNGIPKRLQKPLNADSKEADDTSGPNTGNVSLFLKDLDGTGFSIGINQYVGEPPDKDSMKIFSGIENLIKEYHKTYDQEDVSNESSIDKVDNFVERDHRTAKRSVDYMFDDVNGSTKDMGSDYHSNTYKLYLESNIITDSKKKHIKKVPIIIDERVLNKNLRPSEILTLANYVKRKKRSVNVKKISNLKSKIKLNRYINTNPMAKKNIFLKNKRNKRQVQKIRIIARDHSATPKHSDEGIFLISRENIYSDKGIRDVEDPETVVDKRNRETNDEAIPFGDFFKMQNPDEPPIFSDNEYQTKVRPSVILSKYPHIFMDDITSKNEDSKDYYLNERTAKSKPYRIKNSQRQSKGMNRVESTTMSASMFDNEQKINDFLNEFLPPTSKSKYKVTVRISPKNMTNSSFKEVHTSVNKSYDDNGLRYYSILNVSEISKVEKLNKTGSENENEKLKISYSFNNNLIEQQHQMKTLLRLHKKRVDHQLTALIKERQHLEKMINDNSNININRTLNILNDDEGSGDKKDDKINKILDSVKKLEETYKTTTSPTTTQTITDKPDEAEKIKLIDTIKLNEKVTYEILKKIDTNTNILKTFLQTFENNINRNSKQTTEKNLGEIKLDMTKDWRTYNGKDQFFIGNEAKNDTVPFVYAYQQQIPLNGKEHPLASLMYHGHIHTNTAQDINHNNFKKASMVDKNSTFFVKEMEDFITKPGPFISANIKINTTTV